MKKKNPRKNKRKINYTKISLLCSFLGLIMSIVLIFLSINYEEVPIFGIILLLISIFLLRYNIKTMKLDKLNKAIRNNNEKDLYGRKDIY